MSDSTRRCASMAKASAAPPQADYELDQRGIVVAASATEQLRDQHAQHREQEWVPRNSGAKDAHLRGMVR
jgi:hypothetical protein